MELLRPQRSDSGISIVVPAGEHRTYFEWVNTSPLHKRVSSISVGGNARLEYIYLIEDVGEGKWIEERALEIAEGGRVAMWYCVASQRAYISRVQRIAAGGKLQERELLLAAPQGEYHLESKYILDGGDSATQYSWLGICGAHAKTSLRASGLVTTQARGARIHMDLRSIALDPSTRIDATPALEIAHDEVQASHSASVSQISEVDLFYLRSRGMTPAQARSLIVRGLLSAFVAEIQDDRAKHAILRCAERLV